MMVIIYLSLVFVPCLLRKESHIIISHGIDDGICFSNCYIGYGFIV